ncbi:MAG TPA: PilZ domain-containing protein [Thermoanaerobaculaceae bacterium]|nr:PilZ domain-containing protein [Thermoanaerobaculaceae bacterium]
MARSHGERRRYPRFPADNPVLLKRVAGDGPEAPARTLEIGAGGCKLVHERALGVGTRVELAISAGGRTIRALGRVVFELPLRSARFQLGVAFLQMAPEDRDTLAALLDGQIAATP